MLTVTQITDVLSSPQCPEVPANTSANTPERPSYVPDACAAWLCVCLYCGAILQHPPARSLPETHRGAGMRCPLRRSMPRQHERMCEECASVVSTLWYYQGDGLTSFARPALKPLHLDLYILLLRHMRHDAYLPVSVPACAAELHTTPDRARTALAALCRRGLLEKRREPGRRLCSYRALIWQKPKGE